MGHRSHHVEMAGGAAGEIAAQVREGYKGVPQKAQRLPHQVDYALVLFASFRLAKEKQGIRMKRSPGVGVYSLPSLKKK